jgi:hypothetical protein
VFACTGDEGAVYGEPVGLVWVAVLKRLLEQGFNGVVGFPRVLEQAVGAVRRVGLVGLSEACELGNGFAGRGEDFSGGELRAGGGGVRVVW